MRKRSKGPQYRIENIKGMKTTALSLDKSYFGDGCYIRPSFQKKEASKSKKSKKAPTFEFLPLNLGKNLYIGAGSIVCAESIGDNVYIGKGCIISDGVTIENNVYVQSGTVIPSGVTIPEGCSIAGRPCQIVGYAPPGNTERIKKKIERKRGSTN